MNPLQRLNNEKDGMDEYCVLINLNNTLYPDNLRLTFKNKKSGTIVQIEELDSLESVKCSCQFNGRTKIGDAVACDWMYDVKKMFGGLKPAFIQTMDIHIDSHYRIH